MESGSAVQTVRVARPSEEDLQRLQVLSWPVWTKRGFRV